MVHSISSDSLGNVSPRELLGQPAVDHVKDRETKPGHYVSQPPGLDRTQISQAAIQKYENERLAFGYAREAAKLPEPFDTDKVNHFKELVNSGRLHTYLNQLDTESLAEELLKEPAGLYLAK